MTDLPGLFGSMVFNDTVMRERLPHETYKALKKTIEEGNPLDPSIANVIANSMKDWAIEKGATHYTHWFQPLTGITAEKHDSFLSPQQDGTVIMEFSGKALIQGESDASSFPSGGLRATFEARGYTAWDPTSYAFIKDDTLCIPTAFCSQGGEALDKKTPLLRSMKAINTQALRVLRLFGSSVKHVFPTTGAEQEYFLVDREAYNRRKDLIFTGRTLIGAKPPKGQELDDHYFGTIRLRVSGYMKELDKELWKLGIYSKTEHNEVAPAQHEMAPVFTTANVASDQNQLTMLMMRKVAKKNGLTCLLHEKPFAGVNGSGKHNNWSLSTDTGKNLFNPGKTPEENAQFLLFFCAVIKAVDDYQDLLRISVASGGNDHRLGGDEAPPAIVSMFIGEELDAILTAIETGSHYNKVAASVLEVGVDVLPSIPKDSTDRNRTSPFAFTGNKFEFRMPGSSASIADANTTLNTIVAESLCQFADELEGAQDFKKALNTLIKRTMKDHRRIIFNGNGYDESWVKEAEKRGLSNLATTADAIPHLLDEKNVALFKKQSIFTEPELKSRCEIGLESYCKTQNIEAQTMLEMINADVLPAVLRYQRYLAETINQKRAVSASINCRPESEILEKISCLSETLYIKTGELSDIMNIAQNLTGDYAVLSIYYKDTVIPAMASVRAAADELETLVSSDFWPYPSYGDLLYRV